VAVSIFALYEDAISRFLLLIGFLPMLLGMGGNIGTQSAMIVVRGLATGQFELRQIGTVLWREIRIAGILGIGYGVLLWVASFVVPSLPALSGVVIGSSICAIMILAAAVGAFMPMLFARAGLDAAIATGPFLTSLIDLVGMLVYFELVQTFLLR
jgi:magnesium transporter